MVPLHFMSVEHLSLQRRYGAEKGRRIGEILGLVSGWGFFSFWMGLWLSLLLSGVWLGIGGLREVTLRVAETHRAERVVTTGVYSIVRHPQYLGGLLVHVGASFLLSAWFSLASTPLMVLLNYLVSRKEEEELVREFGEEYEEYRGRVPMFIPQLRRPANTAQ